MIRAYTHFIPPHTERAAIGSEKGITTGGLALKGIYDDKTKTVFGVVYRQLDNPLKIIKLPEFYFAVVVNDYITDEHCAWLYLSSMTLKESAFVKCKSCPYGYYVNNKRLKL